MCRTREESPIRQVGVYPQAHGFSHGQLTSDYSVQGWAEPQVSRSTLRFLDAERLNAFLAEAGLSVSAQYGYWDRTPLTDTSQEIITFARPTQAGDREESVSAALIQTDVVP